MTGPREETIVAICTPVGTGAIAVLRLSGPDAIAISGSLFRGRHALRTAKSHTAHFGQFFDPAGILIDEIVATVFRSPNSYTGEDVVELSCHGSPFIAGKIMEACVSGGARLAKPGEFTMRAYLNGRIDLSQAEAVADLIRSSTDMAHRASMAQVRGSLSGLIRNLRGQVFDLSGFMELELDFSEEGIELMERSEVIARLDIVLAGLDSLLRSFKDGRVALEGAKVVIVGAPNVGKSSLMNALLEDERSIVTEISGTTRDAIEENISIDGLLFRIVDTAGIRATRDVVEIEGIRRTNAHLASADMVLGIIDVTAAREGTGADQLAPEDLREILLRAPKSILVLNKIDIARDEELVEAERRFKDVEVVRVSAMERTGVPQLRQRLRELIVESELNLIDGSVVVTNLRHLESITKASDSLRLARAAAAEGKSNEFIAVDLRRGMDFLGEILGVVTTEDILNSIFSSFCIGK